MAKQNDILILNDDCLLEVFSHLKISDLFAVVDVCERFRKNAIDLFAMKHKALDFVPTHLFTLSKEAYFRKIRHRLQRFGSSATSLKIHGEEKSSCDQRILEQILQYCGSNLKELTLFDFEVRNSFLGRLQPLFVPLERLHLNESGAFTKLLNHCGDLKALKLSNMFFLDFELKFKCPKLETLKMDDVYMVSNTDLKNLFKLNPQLRKLSFDSGHYFDDAVVPIIAKYLPLIEDLSLNIRMTSKFEQNIRHLRQMTALKKLTFRSSNGYRYNNFYSAIKEIATAKIPLEELDLWSVDSVDERLATAVSTIRTIKTLSLRGTHGLNIPQLIRIAGHLTELTSLIWSGNARLNIGDVVDLISKTQKLRKIILKGRRRIEIDANAFSLLLDAARNRSEQSPLEIGIFVKYHSQVPAEMVKAHMQTMVIFHPNKMPKIPKHEW